MLKHMPKLYLEYVIRFNVAHHQCRKSFSFALFECWTNLSAAASASICSLSGEMCYMFNDIRWEDQSIEEIYKFKYEHPSIRLDTIFRKYRKRLKTM